MPLQQRDAKELPAKSADCVSRGFIRGRLGGLVLTDVMPRVPADPSGRGVNVFRFLAFYQFIQLVLSAPDREALDLAPDALGLGRSRNGISPTLQARQRLQSLFLEVVRTQQSDEVEQV